MSGITIPIEIELTPRSRAIMEALAKALPPSRVDGEAGTVQTAAQPVITRFKIGEHYKEAGGIYAGLSKGEGDHPDGHLFLLPEKPDGKLNWADATAWAQGLGQGARLPTRFESALLYANLQDQLDTESWHWTGTQYSDLTAWGQDFYDGDQGSGSKSYEVRCRAVRRLLIL